jgi:hypothetical protein
MTRPVRLQLSRKKGFSLQALSLATNGLPAVNVARPNRWGNPFTIKGCREAGFVGTDIEIAERCVEAFRVWIDTHHWRCNWDGPESESARKSILTTLDYLHGKNLACWCKIGDPCHATVLLELAARPICEPA